MKEVLKRIGEQISKTFNKQTMTTKCIQTALLALIAIIWAGCDKEDGLTDKVETIKMYVSAETGTHTPWGSETPTECMLVKEEGESEYSYLDFGGIKGFDYVRGHEYEFLLTDAQKRNETCYIQI